MTTLTGEFPVYMSGTEAGTVTVSQNGQTTVFDCACTQKSRDILRLAAVCEGKYIPLGVLVPEAGVLRLKKSYTRNGLAFIGYQDAQSYHLVKPAEVYADAPALRQATADAGTPRIAVSANTTEKADEAAADTRLAPTANSIDTTVSVPEAPLHTTEHDDAFEEMPLLKVHGDAEPESTPDSPSAVGGWRPIGEPARLFDDETISEACQGIEGALTTEQDGLTLLAVPVSPSAPFPMMSIFCFGEPFEIGSGEYLLFKIKNGSLSF
ncbi:hypothetical protein IZU99_09015 [Oscillospiraceae bacterium CM]|nr:hypothetical protein IZU99_09015 [Oscillospiraceae bacterium CM]